LVANSGANLSYQWTLNGNNIVSGINASYLPTATGSYAVKVTDSSTGCTKTSDVTLLSSSFLMTPNGTNTFCGSQLLTVPLGSSNGYQWKKDGVIISGANSNIFNANQSGNYTCVVSNGGCSFTTAMTVLNTTLAPTGSSNQTFTAGQTLANLLVTGTNLLWYSVSFGGNNIPNSTSLVSGTTYYVSQNINGCEGPRLAVTVTPLLDTENFNTFDINYYPNPVKDYLSIKSSQNITKSTVFNTLGQIIQYNNQNGSEIQLNFSNLPSGYYFVKVESDNKKNVFKIIKR
jgi:hypothetical protein